MIFTGDYLPDFVIITISDDRIESAVAFTEFPRIILLANGLSSSSLTFLQCAIGFR